MVLNLADKTDTLKAEAYFAKLLKDQSKIELKKIPERRTLSQNSYLHALFTLFGGHFGYNVDETKQVIKQRLGYTYIRDGVEYLMQTRRMDSGELTILIEKFRNLSAHEGYYLPTPEQFSENYVEMMKQVEAVESQMNRYSY